MSRFYLVDLDSISCDESRSTFDTTQIDTLAKNIAEIGSLFEPLILEATSLQTYRVLSGSLEYYAAVRASEINPDIEMVNSFVVESDQIEMVKEQLQILKPKIITPPPLPGNSNAELEKRINNMESRLNQDLQTIKATLANEVKTLKKDIESLQSNLPQKVEPLERFNNLPELELMQAIRKAGIVNKIAQTLTANLLKARSDAPFTSYTDVVSRTKQLGDKRMLQILDSWSGFST